MNQSSAGEAYHENLTIRLKECCKECPFTTSNRPCKKSKKLFKIRIEKML